MQDTCSSCGKEVPWVEFYRCEKCDSNVCGECVVNKNEMQLCPACAGEEA